MKHLILTTPAYTEYLEGFARHTERLGYAPASRPTFCSHVKEFLHWIEGQSLMEITTLRAVHIKSHYVYLKERPGRQGGSLGSSMVTLHLYSIRLFIAYLQMEGILKADPMGNLVFDSLVRKERDILTRQEISQLYKACETLRDTAMLSLLYGCGLRSAEVCSLDVTDIHFRGLVLFVRRGKNGKRREVPIGTQVSRELKDYCYEGRPLYTTPGNMESLTGFLLKDKGTRVNENWLWNRIKYLCSKAGIRGKRVSPHTLRHTIATHLLENGMDIEYVRQFLGHSCLETTQLYTRIIPQQINHDHANIP